MKTALVIQITKTALKVMMSLNNFLFIFIYSGDGRHCYPHFFLSPLAVLTDEIIVSSVTQASSIINASGENRG